LPAADTAALRAALERGQLSARGFDRVLRLASTAVWQNMGAVPETAKGALPYPAGRAPDLRLSRY
jgi:hypothetical protein